VVSTHTLSSTLSSFVPCYLTYRVGPKAMSALCYVACIPVVQRFTSRCNPHTFLCLARPSSRHLCSPQTTQSRRDTVCERVRTNCSSLKVTSKCWRSYMMTPHSSWSQGYVSKWTQDPIRTHCLDRNSQHFGKFTIPSINTTSPLTAPNGFRPVFRLESSRARLGTQVRLAFLQFKAY
jgi:hypothetical protein